MTPTYEYTAELAMLLSKFGKRMPASELAEHLNRRNLQCPKTGQPYPTRGKPLFNALRAIYNQLAVAGRQSEADAVAEAFTLDNGVHAWAA
jgi:hypothetical protein